MIWKIWKIYNIINPIYPESVNNRALPTVLNSQIKKMQIMNIIANSTQTK